MEMHTRAIIKCRHSRQRYPYWANILDFGIPYTPNREKARNHPRVLEETEHMRKFYDIIEIDFRDT